MSQNRTRFCAECGAKLPNGGWPNPNNPEEIYCKMHFDQKVGGAPAGVESVDPNSLKTIFCAECGKSLAGSLVVTIGPHSYHSSCFTCSKCGKEVAQLGFKESGGKRLCPSCGKTSAGFCGGCGKPISGIFLTVDGSKFHKECFRCVACNSVLQSGFAEVNGQPHCASCAQAKAKPVTTTVVVEGERRQGFTIDPRTGVKKYR